MSQEKEKAPEREQEVKHTISLSFLSDNFSTELESEPPFYSEDELKVAAEVLNVIGKHGYSVSDAFLILHLCEIAVKKCTLIGSDYTL